MRPTRKNTPRSRGGGGVACRPVLVDLTEGPGGTGDSGDAGSAASGQRPLGAGPGVGAEGHEQGGALHDSLTPRHWRAKTRNEAKALLRQEAVQNWQQTERVASTAEAVGRGGPLPAGAARRRGREEEEGAQVRRRERSRGPDRVEGVGSSSRSRSRAVRRAKVAATRSS